jgi:hypothetical protein
MLTFENVSFMAYPLMLLLGKIDYLGHNFLYIPGTIVLVKRLPVYVENMYPCSLF